MKLSLITTDHKRADQTHPYPPLDPTARIRTNLDKVQRIFAEELKLNPFKRTQRAMLREWQISRMRQTYDWLFRDEKLSAGAKYMIEELYAGNIINLMPIAQQIEKTLPLATRLFGHNLLNTAAIAIELQVITQEIDHALCAHLFDNVKEEPITTTHYVKAYQTAGQHAARMAQLDLAIALATCVDKYLNKNWLYGAFRLARRPALRAQVGDLYDFMHKAFNVMRVTPDARSIITHVAQIEKSISLKLSVGQNPFPRFQG